MWVLPEAVVRRCSVKKGVYKNFLKFTAFSEIHRISSVFVSGSWFLSILLTLFRIGGSKRLYPTSFSSVTSSNVGVSPQNFLTFSFNPFATLVLHFKFVASATPKLLNFNHDTPVHSTSWKYSTWWKYLL